MYAGSSRSPSLWFGERDASNLASSAFMVSVSGMQTQQTLILTKSWLDYEGISQPLDYWKLLTHLQQLANPSEISQIILDKMVVDKTFQSHRSAENQAMSLSQTSTHDRRPQQRLASRGADFSTQFLLNQQALHVATGLWRGTELCQTQQCICGIKIDTRGSHTLSCKHNANRAHRRHHINDQVRRAMT